MSAGNRSATAQDIASGLGARFRLRHFDHPPTVETEVFDILREGILSGALPPGYRLRMAEIAAELRTSTLPVRTALTRLQVEGLVNYTAHRGSAVAPLEFDELEEIQAVRVGIEGLAARLGVVALDASQLSLMAARLAELRSIAAAADLDQFLEAEWRFRATCLSASGRHRLLGLVIDYRHRAERYLRVAFSHPQGLRKSIRYQCSFLDACENRDPASAEESTRKALEWTLATLRPYFPLDI